MGEPRDGSALGSGVASGTRIIVLIVGLGLLAAGYAVWHHYRAGRDARQWWGVERAMLVRDAPRVEAWKLGPSDAAASAESNHVLRVDGKALAIEQQREVSGASGLLHVREQLLKDNSYEWQAASSVEPRWEYALRFSDPAANSNSSPTTSAGRSVVVLFDTRQALLRGLEQPARLSYVPVRNFVNTFLERQFPEPLGHGGRTDQTDRTD